MIKTVLLDLGNVILPVDFRRCHDLLAAACPCPVDQIQGRLSGRGLVERFETGAISSDDFFREVSDLLEMNVPQQQFWEIWSSIFAPEPFIPDAMIEGLGKHQRLLLLSNTNANHFVWLREKYPLLAHFDDYVLSYEVGAMKPSPRIYHEAIARAECAPGECFFTDDIEAYAEAARREGIDAVQFRSLPQLQGELKARGVKW
jgi:glucose-1-phosphatase